MRVHKGADDAMLVLPLLVQLIVPTQAVVFVSRTFFA